MRGVAREWAGPETCRRTRERSGNIPQEMGERGRRTGKRIYSVLFIFLFRQSTTGRALAPPPQPHERGGVSHRTYEERHLIPQIKLDLRNR